MATNPNEDWRNPATRQKVANNIKEFLELFLPFSKEEGLAELKTAVEFEETSYAAAENLEEYLRAIAVMLLATVEEKSQKLLLVAPLPNPGNQETADSAASTTTESNSVPITENGGWKSRLPPGSRERVVNKMMDTFKKHPKIFGPVGLLELEKLAVRFEEKTYSAAKTRVDYLRMISLNMLMLELEFQPPKGKALQFNPGTSDEDPEATLEMIRSILF